MKRELKIYHPNAKGTGSCLKISGTSTDAMFQVFSQRASRGGFPGFDWDHPADYVVDWRDLAEMLMVFRGECESLGDGMGLSYAYDAGWSRLMLRHVIEPVHCYALDIYNPRDGGESRGIFNLSPAEALGLSLIIEGMLHHTLIGGES